MSQKLKIEIVEDIVKVEVSGEFSLSNAKDFFRKILAQARERGLIKILIDTRTIEGEISTMERFNFGAYMSALEPGGIRIALIGRKDMVWPDRFLENVSVNRGVITKVTADPKEALEWLRSYPSG